MREKNSLRGKKHISKKDIESILAEYAEDEKALRQHGKISRLFCGSAKLCKDVVQKVDHNPCCFIALFLAGEAFLMEFFRPQRFAADEMKWAGIGKAFAQPLSRIKKFIHSFISFH